MAEKKTNAERWNEFLVSLQMKSENPGGEIVMKSEHLDALEKLSADKAMLTTKLTELETSNSTLTSENKALREAKTTTEADLAKEKTAHAATQKKFNDFQAESGGDGKDPKKTGADSVEEKTKKESYVTSADTEAAKLKAELA